MVNLRLIISDYPDYSTYLELGRNIRGIELFHFGIIATTPTQLKRSLNPLTVEGWM